MGKTSFNYSIKKYQYYIIISVSDNKFMIVKADLTSIVIYYRKQTNKEKQQHIENAYCRKRFQPPTVIPRGASVEEDKVTVIPKY